MFGCKPPLVPVVALLGDAERDRPWMRLVPVPMGLLAMVETMVGFVLIVVSIRVILASSMVDVSDDRGVDNGDKPLDID